MQKLFKLELSENLTIAPLQCLAFSKRPMCLRILSEHGILTSIKGYNSLTKGRSHPIGNLQRVLPTHGFL